MRTSPRSEDQLRPSFETAITIRTALLGALALSIAFD
jgi:hypothetical protein